MIERPWDIRDRSFQFACNIVRFCRDLARDPSCRRIANQLLDSGTSVGANTWEAKSAYSRAEFAYKNGLALKEARESVFWLRVIIACELTRDSEAHVLLKEAGELVGIFNGIVRSSRRPLPRVTAPLLVLLLTSSF
jgi:four helix bundle protein